METGLQIAVVRPCDTQAERTALIAAHNQWPPVCGAAEADGKVSGVRSVEQAAPILLAGQPAPARPVKVFQRNDLGGCARRLILDGARLALDDSQLLLLLCKRQGNQVLLRAQAKRDLHRSVPLAEHAVGTQIAFVKERHGFAKRQERGRFQLTHAIVNRIGRNAVAAGGERQALHGEILCDGAQRLHADLRALVRRFVLRHPGGGLCAPKRHRPVACFHTGEGDISAVFQIAPPEDERIGKLLGKILPLRPAHGHTKLDVFPRAEQGIVRQDKSPSLHSLRVKIKQRDLRHPLCLQRLLLGGGALLARGRSGKLLTGAASPDGKQLSERSRSLEHIRQLRARHIEVGSRLKENLPGVLAVVLTDQTGPRGHLHTGNTALDQVHHHHAAGRIGRTQGEVQHVHKLGVVFFHHQIHPADVFLHLIGKNQANHRAHIGVHVGKGPFGRVGSRQPPDLAAQILNTAGIQLHIIVFHWLPPPSFRHSDKTGIQDYPACCSP